MNSFDEQLEFASSVSVQEIIEASTDWTVQEGAGMNLHTHHEGYVVAVTEYKEEPIWPDFTSIDYSLEMQEELDIQWKTSTTHDFILIETRIGRSKR